MQPRSEQEIFGRVEQQKVFNADDVRWILGRAAEEQHRLDSELAGSYSVEELGEMAAEAGISREALRAAIERRPSWIAVLLRRIPGNWSPPSLVVRPSSQEALVIGCRRRSMSVGTLTSCANSAAYRLKAAIGLN